MGTRVFSPAALVTLALFGASCSLSVDGLAVGADEGDGTDPARAGALPGATDAGASLSSSAPPVVIPPEAGAPVTPPGPGVAPPMGGSPSPPAMTPPAMTPPAMTPPPATPPAMEPRPVVVRAHDVKVKRLVAGTVYLHKLEAKTGTAGRITILPEPLLGLDLGSKKLEAEELIVDTLYAHDVEAEHVQITETHASEVKIGKKGRGEGGDSD